MRNRDRRGFTLLELMAVFAVIALVIAVVAPKLLPLAVHFGHEGAARELAAYGEAVIQHAKLNNEEVFVKFDLDKGAYWVEHWVPEDPEEADGEEEEAADGAATLQESVSASMEDPQATDEERAKTSERVGEHFADFAEQRLRAQAELVEPNRTPKEEDRAMRPDLEFEGDRERRMVKEPLAAELLEKRRMPEGVSLESIALPGESSRSGVVELVVSPLGLDRDVRMKLVDEDGGVLGVRWDPILGRGFVYAVRDDE